MRIAITGHRGLPAATERLVDQAIREQLAAYAVTAAQQLRRALAFRAGGMLSCECQLAMTERRRRVV
jgi:hypothetical protein